MKFAAYFNLSIGVMMVLQWIFFLAAGQVPELQTAPWEIACHIIAELMTAGVLILSGFGLLRSASWAKTIAILGLGMVMYSSVNSAGYFAQKGEWVFIVMFAVLLCLAMVALHQLKRSI
jgi:hypothetical protein